MSPIKYITGFLFILFLCAGCATDDTLDLDDVKAAKARKSEEAVASRELASGSLQGSAAALFSQSNMRSRERELIHLPEGFHVVDYRGALKLKQKHALEVISLERAHLWHHGEKDVVFAFVEESMQSSATLGMSRDQFIDELDVVGKQGAQFYKTLIEPNVLYVVDKKKPILQLRFKAHFLHEGTRYSHWRYLYYFRPEYRVDILISGNKENVTAVLDDLRQTLIAFEERLAILYPEGIVFKAA